MSLTSCQFRLSDPFPSSPWCLSLTIEFGSISNYSLPPLPGLFPVSSFFSLNRPPDLTRMLISNYIPFTIPLTHPLVFPCFPPPVKRCKFSAAYAMILIFFCPFPSWFFFFSKILTPSLFLFFPLQLIESLCAGRFFKEMEPFFPS